MSFLDRLAIAALLGSVAIVLCALVVSEICADGASKGCKAIKAKRDADAYATTLPAKYRYGNAQPAVRRRKGWRAELSERLFDGGGDSAWLDAPIVAPAAFTAEAPEPTPLEPGEEEIGEEPNPAPDGPVGLPEVIEGTVVAAEDNPYAHIHGGMTEWNREQVALLEEALRQSDADREAFLANLDKQVTAYHYAPRHSDWPALDVAA